MRVIRSGLHRAAAVALLLGVLAARTDAAPSPEFAQVRKAGSGQIPVILVPCLGCDWRSFDEFMERNAERYTLYAVTWPGMGSSSLPAVEIGARTPYWEYILEALAALIRSEGMKKPVLLGHSAAGPYVIDFAHRHPDLVFKVISVDAVITNEDTLGFTRDRRDQWAEAEMADVHRRFATEEKWRAFNEKAAQGLGARSAMYVDMWLAPPKEHVFAYWRDWLKTDAGAMLPALTVPLLTIHAVPSRTTDSAAFRKKVLERYRRNGATPATCIAFVENAGHTIWEYLPEEFDRIVASFIEGSMDDCSAGAHAASPARPES